MLFETTLILLAGVSLLAFALSLALTRTAGKSDEAYDKLLRMCIAEERARRKSEREGGRRYGD